MKELMLSIQPKWVEKIAKGEKTMEIRKNLPKCDLPFKVYIYCTKPSKKHQTVHGCMIFNSDELFRDIKGNIKHGDSIELMAEDGEKYTEHNFLNGKVVGEFVCREVEQFTVGSLGCDDILITSCVSYAELINYFYKNGVDGTIKQGYAWHISDLVIYDKPKELNEFYKPEMLNYDDWLYGIYNGSHGREANYAVYMREFEITKAPQSYCFVETR